MSTYKHLARILATFMMFACAATTTQAAPVNFTLTGDLEAVEAGNPFGLTPCTEPGTTCTDSITATGSFDDSTFDVGFLGNIYQLTDLNIVVGSEIFTNSMDFFFGYGEITLEAGIFKALDYSAAADNNGANYNFDSVTIAFNSTDQLNGSWLANSYTTAVPVPAAVWLFGSGLLGLAGIAGKKKT